jgi:hypothetical protein
MMTIVDCFDPCQALPACKLAPFTTPCICMVSVAAPLTEESPVEDGGATAQTAKTSTATKTTAPAE